MHGQLPAPRSEVPCLPWCLAHQCRPYFFLRSTKRQSSRALICHSSLGSSSSSSTGAHICERAGFESHSRPEIGAVRPRVDIHSRTSNSRTVDSREGARQRHTRWLAVWFGDTDTGVAKTRPKGGGG